MIFLMIFPVQVMTKIIPHRYSGQSFFQDETSFREMSEQYREMKIYYLWKSAY